jgi:hypothetical protein
MKNRMLMLLAIASLLLAGCTTPRIRSDVTVFHDWPAQTRGQSFVFERTTAQHNDLEYRSYEDLVRKELLRLGFVEAGPATTPQIKATLSYGISGRDVRVIEPVAVGPYWYPPPFYYPYPRWRGYYHPSPLYDPFWYGGRYTEYQETNYELFKRYLKIMLANAADGKKLYDVTVTSEGRNGELAVVMPYMVRSAFVEFPARNGESRRIELDMAAVPK